MLNQTKDLVLFAITVIVVTEFDCNQDKKTTGLVNNAYENNFGR